MAERCTATTQAGTRCGMYPPAGSKVCHRHGAAVTPGGLVHGLRSGRLREADGLDRRAEELMKDDKLLQLRRDVAYGQANLEQMHLEITDELATAYWQIANGKLDDDGKPHGPTRHEIALIRNRMASQQMRPIAELASIRATAVKLEVYQAWLEQVAWPLMEELFQVFSNVARHYVPPMLMAPFEDALKAAMAATVRRMEALKPSA
jgi:hypothetical protein